MKKQSIGVGLMGLGVVGGGVARVLLDRAPILAEQVSRGDIIVGEKTD